MSAERARTATAERPQVAPISEIPARLLFAASGRESLPDYESRGGYRSGGYEGRELIEAIEAAGLRGRGGAAFPTGVKLRAVAGREGVRHVVANGEEGEPTSIKDRWLMRARPHLVLDGLLRTAAAVGAAQAHVYLSDGPAAQSVAEALEELGTTPIPVRITRVEPAYVAGEETAAVRAIGGGPAKPLDKPPRPFEAGVDGQPTLVANVETLANVPLVASLGPDWFRRAGTEHSPGTFLLTLSGACRAPGLYEIELGTSLGVAIERAGGLICDPGGFLMGGFFGGIIGSRALDLPLDYGRLRDEGSGLGCGAITVFGEDACPVAIAAGVMSFFAESNAKQCGPCIRGTSAMRDALAALSAGPAEQPAVIERLQGWSVSLRGRGACATLDGAAGLVTSLFREFPDHVASHLAGPCKRCSAEELTPDPTTRFSVPISDQWGGGSG